jgi:NTE family protein
VSTVGLVLGAGGVVGQAYHAGVLCAIEREWGFDARQADIIVGSSAGSVTGTLLRMGVSPNDLAALAYGSPLSPPGAALLERVLPNSSDLPHPSPFALLRPWRAPSPALITRVARRPWAFRPSVAAMTLLPGGSVDISDRAAPLDQLAGEYWPRGLWICAARRRDGARVVFGRDGAPPARIAQAVLASCAIPGYFRPIVIGGVEYVDGGVHSATNANVLREEHLDLVVVISPMSCHGRPVGPDGLVRWSMHRRLEREVLRLKAAGTHVIRIEPGSAARSVMGINAMAEDRSDRVVVAAYEETKAMGTRLAHLLSSRHYQRAAAI